MIIVFIELAQTELGKLNGEEASGRGSCCGSLRIARLSLSSALVIAFSILAMPAQAQNPPGNTNFDLVPIGSTGTVTSLVGNDIVIPGGDVVVELELRISGWAATGDGDLLSAQATIDGSGYCSGVGDPLYPVGYPGAPVFSCPQGNGCPDDGFTCADGGFLWTSACIFSSNAGERCNGNADCPGGLCLDDPSNKFVYGSLISVISYPGLNYQYALDSQFGAIVDDGSYDMFGTLLVEIPPDAIGTYNMNFLQDSEKTFSADGVADFFAVVNLNGASITIPSGSCCFNFGPGTTQCVNNVSETTCEALEQPIHFRPGKQCGPNSFPDTGNGFACDNCPLFSNVDQSDVDGDGIGDVCDNCLTISNTSQSNLDGDSAGDVCDDCPEDPNKLTPGICGCGQTQTEQGIDNLIAGCSNCKSIADAMAGNCPQTIPTVSEWGLVVLSLLLLVCGKLYFGRRPTNA